MKIEDVKVAKLVAMGAKAGCEAVLPGEIPGTTVHFHTLKAGEVLRVEPEADAAFIFMTVSGEFVFVSGKTEQSGAGRWVFIPGFADFAELRAKAETRLLQIRWEIPENGRVEWKHPEHEFPYCQEYFSALQYRDLNKSDKTISRELVRQRIVPGFCMGSVESYGYDLVKQHPHPMLDQFFFSFPENDIDVLIDDIKVPMKGDELLHIPLGSNHGAEVTGDRHMHYMWIDFFLGQAGLDRLDRSHKHTGTMRSFDK